MDEFDDYLLVRLKGEQISGQRYILDSEQLLCYPPYSKDKGIHVVTISRAAYKLIVTVVSRRSFPFADKNSLPKSDSQILSFLQLKFG